MKRLHFVCVTFVGDKIQAKINYICITRRKTIVFKTFLSSEETFHAKEREVHECSMRENAGSGHVTYTEICASLGITPIRRILDQFRLTEMRLVHVGMNGSDCKALACALWVRIERERESDRERERERDTHTHRDTQRKRGGIVIFNPFTNDKF